MEDLSGITNGIIIPKVIYDSIISDWLGEPPLVRNEGLHGPRLMDTIETDIILDWFWSCLVYPVLRK